MKTKKLAIFLFTLILAIGLLPMNVFAAQRDIVAGSTASITVNSAVENDVLAAYKVIDIAYDATSNHLTYAWNSDFAEYFERCTIRKNGKTLRYADGRPQLQSLKKRQEAARAFYNAFVNQKFKTGGKLKLILK